MLVILSVTSSFWPRLDASQMYWIKEEKREQKASCGYSKIINQGLWLILGVCMLKTTTVADSLLLPAIFLTYVMWNIKIKRDSFSSTIQFSSKDQFNVSKQTKLINFSWQPKNNPCECCHIWTQIVIWYQTKYLKY